MLYLNLYTHLHPIVLTPFGPKFHSLPMCASLPPLRHTNRVLPCFCVAFRWIDRRNCSLADVKAFLGNTDFTLEGPSSLFSESDSLRSDSPLSVPYSGIFFFPFSLRVSHLLSFLSGAGNAEPSLHYLPTLLQTGCQTDPVACSVHSTEMKSDYHRGS